MFAEIGRAFARFYASCLDDETWQGERIDAFCAGLRPGDPPEGQGLLRQAFGQIYAALFEPDAKLAGERLFLANVLIGCHEQNRLQPEIAAAVDAPFMDGAEFVNRLLAILFPRTAWLVRRSRLAWQRLLGRRPLLDVMAEALLQRTHRQTRLAITELMMTIAFPPDVRLRLGRDLSGEYPAALRELTFAELGAMLESLDPTPDSLSESGAADWASLPDRLHFIVELFRLYHEAADLFTPPFTAEQVAALKEGRPPDGRL